MPELPEVETVRRGLAPFAEGQVIAGVEARRPDLRYPLPENFTQRLTGARIGTLRRRAKYLLADLDTGETLISHLGMSGRWIVAGAAPGHFAHGHAPRPQHTHIVLELASAVRLEFNDPRRFGFVDLAPTHALAAHRAFRALGPEPLGRAFTPAVLAAALRGKAAPVKSALLDQRVLAGLGNIYVCEALFAARIAPFAPAGALSPAACRRLTAAIKAVLEEACAAGGSSISDFAAATGELGAFQHRFAVYGRQGAPCPACAAPIQREVQSGRSTFFCSTCQGEGGDSV